MLPSSFVFRIFTEWILFEDFRYEVKSIGKWNLCKRTEHDMMQVSKTVQMARPGFPV